MSQLTRRTFLSAAAMLFPAPYQRPAAALRKKVKITDAGVYGIGEA